jgi:hypothetical protein
MSDFLEGDRKKLGGMTPGAMTRLGLAELREAVSLDSGNEGSTPYGMYGTLTPGEVAAERRDDPQVQQLEQEMGDHKADRAMTPGEIAMEGGTIFGTDRTQENTRDAGGMTPGDIAQDNGTYAPDQDYGRDNGAGRGR